MAKMLCFVGLFVEGDLIWDRKSDSKGCQTLGCDTVYSPLQSATWTEIFKPVNTSINAPWCYRDHICSLARVAREILKK